MSQSQAEFEALVAKCRQMIRVGSKSFSLAAHTFGKTNRDAAFLLYGWCRYCDDEIDKVVDQTSEEGKALMAKKLDGLREQTEAAYSNQKLEHPVFQAMQYLRKVYGIPRHYPFELLEGMAMDIENVRYNEFQDLSLYCYRVAGTVGLMMTHIMGASHDRALKHAADLGIAMQLTNISRDILEDAGMGRVYLPESWLREENLKRNEVALPESRVAVARLVVRLLDKANVYYRSGDVGLSYLSFRSACTISAARHVYAEIGVRVRSLGPSAWDNRVWVPLGRKLWVMAIGIFKVVGNLPKRWFRPWRGVPIQEVWRHA